MTEMNNPLVALVRTAKLQAAYTKAKIRARHPRSPKHRLPVRFCVGCGRSGTTILGKMLAKNPSACYFYEPYHLWSIIDPRLDVTGLFSNPSNAGWFFEASDLTPAAKKRFDELIGRVGSAHTHRAVIEKLPHNACRLGWIDATEPGARVVHIVRDGLDVVRSIERLASNPTYTLAFRPEYNQWWGLRDAKWNAMSREGPARGYFAEEVRELKEHAQRGAYEWLLSLGEVDRSRDLYGERILEITYPQLVNRTGEICEQIADHFGLDAMGTWIDRASSMISDERKNEGPPLRLPSGMMQAFNSYQERHGFAGRAQSL